MSKRQMAAGVRRLHHEQPQPVCPTSKMGFLSVPTQLFEGAVSLSLQVSKLRLSPEPWLAGTVDPICGLHCWDPVTCEDVCMTLCEFVCVCVCEPGGMWCDCE